MLARCFLRRRAAMQVKVTGEKPIDDLSVLRKRRRTFPFYLVDPLRRKKAIPDRRNPMTAREVTWGIVRNASTLVRIFYLSLTFCAFGSLWIVLFREWQEGTMVWLAVEMGLVVFVAPALLCNAMAREYEQGNIDMIRMTLLSPRRIVMGKVAAGTLCLTPVLIAALMSCVPILIFGSEARLMVVKGMTTMFVCALVSLGLGICVSMLSNRTVTAIVLGYLATGGPILRASVRIADRGGDSGGTGGGLVQFRGGVGTARLPLSHHCIYLRRRPVVLRSFDRVLVQKHRVVHGGRLRTHRTVRPHVCLTSDA